jgi:DNA-binding MarR family transcriptional regulator
VKPVVSPGSCPRGGSIGYLLRRAYKLSVPLAESLFVGQELSFTQWIALIQLRTGVIDTCGALARFLDHDSGATTRMLDQLEGCGLVSRRRSATDRRVVHLSLTDAGHNAAEALMPRIDALWRDVLTGFDPKEVTLLTRLLQRLIDRLDAETVNRGLA